jgi:hypothetical protein
MPQSLGAKFERRTRDYVRCHRLGVLSVDLDKMRKEIKIHRNMKDHHRRFVESPRTDDPTDTRVLNHQGVTEGPPPKDHALRSGEHRGETFELRSRTSTVDHVFCGGGWNDLMVSTGECNVVSSPDALYTLGEPGTPHGDSGRWYDSDDQLRDASPLSLMIIRRGRLGGAQPH